MKFNLFLLLLTIFAVVALAYPNDQRTGTNLLKRQKNPNCRINCCTPGNDKCVQECGKPTCTCNPKASCCRDADQTCKDNNTSVAVINIKILDQSDNLQEAKTGLKTKCEQFNPPCFGTL
ncbi:14277_t:CDS:2 [Funneliformis mosseae]|uniref:14277_t:CDS:1 n=1 Tax=Funneliformis mosseae TaxID=27381 RepID=A0A9N8Z4V7_FUNMO|nr:14277_t:CDS:2 [Funneliformis mosseae]